MFGFAEAFSFLLGVFLVSFLLQKIIVFFFLLILNGLLAVEEDFGFMSFLGLIVMPSKLTFWFYLRQKLTI